MVLRGRSHTKPGSLLEDAIKSRTWAQWNDAVPGFVEIDLVGHEGGNAMGEHCYRRCRKPHRCSLGLAPSNRGTPRPRLMAGSPRQPSGPRDIAADGYPFPTGDAVTATRRQQNKTRVITTLPQRPRQTAAR